MTHFRLVAPDEAAAEVKRQRVAALVGDSLADAAADTRRGRLEERQGTAWADRAFYILSALLWLATVLVAVSR